MSEERFYALYRSTARDLLGYFIRRTQAPEEAADCLAETFLVAWRKHDKIPSDEAQARPWVFGVARNVLRRAREQGQKRCETVEALAAEVRHARATIPTDDPGTAALTLLSRVDREIIEMLVWDQLSASEVATILELSPNAVRIRAHRARLKLREHLGTVSPDLARHTTTH